MFDIVSSGEKERTREILINFLTKAPFRGLFFKGIGEEARNILEKSRKVERDLASSFHFISFISRVKY